MLGYFFRLSRPVNLFIAWLTFCLAAYLSMERDWRFVQSWLFWAEGALITGIMASGYWINDVFDRKIDNINKPQKALVGRVISAKKVLTGYFVAVAVCAAGTLFLPFKFQLLNFGALGALYFYASIFKRKAVIGNLLVAALTAAVVLAGGLLFHLKWPTLWGMVFAFTVTFIREVTKDVEDMRGDLYYGLQTLPIQIGIRACKTFLLVCYVVFLFFTVCPVLAHYALRQKVLYNYIVVSFFLVQLPALFVAYRVWRASHPRQFGLQSAALKWIIFGGLLSILFLE